MRPFSLAHAVFASPLFAHPEWIEAAAAIILATGLCIVGANLWIRERVRRVTGSRSYSIKQTWTSDTVLLLALTAICVALLGPRIGERTISIPGGGPDVVFLVDVSRSMDATDVPPTRLDRARRAVEETLGRMDPGGRAALAIFANRGLLLTPLTPDRNALLDLLADIDTGVMEPASSNVAGGIHAALAAFDAASDRPRVIVVASDGEDSRRRGDSGAATAARQKVRVVTLALGTDVGVHIPDSGGVLRDREGNPAVTRRNADRLARLAAATDGVAFVGDEWGRLDFARVADAVGRDSAARGESVERRVGAIRVIPFAALAFVLLLVEGLPRGGAAQRRRLAWGATGAIAPLLAGSLLMTPAARGKDPEAIPSPAAIRTLEEIVRDAPEDARARIDLGIAYLAIGSSEEAARAFLTATVHAREAAVASTAYFDLGVAALDQNDLARARDAFFDALVLVPTDDAARFNLEWTLAALRSESEQSSAAPDQAAAAAPPESDASPESDPGSLSPDPRQTREEAGDALELTAADRRRWLDRVSEDSRQWLRVTTIENRLPRNPARDPAW